MRIVDVPIGELQRARRRGRSRSPETVQLIEAIESLTPSQAKAIVVEPGQDPQKLRGKLNYAAKVAGKRLQIAIEDDQVVFARSRRRSRRSN